jgi:N-acetylmuramic acid 6-phosphate (MurNAc-6-P) etherase
MSFFSKIGKGFANVGKAVAKVAAPVLRIAAPIAAAILPGGGLISAGAGIASKLLEGVNGQQSSPEPAVPIAQVLQQAQSVAFGGQPIVATNTVASQNANSFVPPELPKTTATASQWKVPAMIAGGVLALFMFIKIFKIKM